MQSLAKASISPHGPSTSMLSKETSVSTLKYSITINEEVVNRVNIESHGMEAGNEPVCTCLG